MYQSLTIIGRLGRDPEMRFTPQGQGVCQFSVAVDSKKDDAKVTTWFRVSAWGKLAETCNAYLRKGSLVLVEGRVKASAYLDKDQQPQASLEVTADAVKFLSGKDEQHVEEF